MTIRPLAMLAAALLALPWATSAVAVQWRIDGTLTDVEPYPAGSIPSGIAVGNPFSVLVGFDTAAPLTTGTGDPFNSACRPPTNLNPCPAPGGGGYQYRYDPSSITMVVNFGNLGPFSFDMAGAGKSGAFIVRDNYPGPVSLANPLVDGLTFTLNADAPDPTSDSVNLQLIFRGTNASLLDIPATGIPAMPPPGLTSLETATFQVSLTDYLGNGAFISGNVLAVTAVPEPDTVALMALGLAGLALLRRKSRPGSPRPRAVAGVARPATAAASLDP